MVTSRERVMQALNFEQPHRLPKDLGGMRSTGISAFAYPKLVEALGLAARRPKIHDVWQMLALPDMDVLDALECDVVAIDNNVNNAFEEPEKWQGYDFGGRLEALVPDRSVFREGSDGVIRCEWEGRKLKMPPSSVVFDEEHGGQSVDWGAEIPKRSLESIRAERESERLSDEQVADFAGYCKRVREATDKAVFLSGWIGNLMGIGWYGGIGIFPVLCITEPDYVRALHEMVNEYALERVRKLLGAIKDYVDIIMISADDWGTQNSLVASPQVYRDLFMPYVKKVNDECHRLAPEVKLFLHNCGAIYPMIDMIVESGFDVLNPVQWSAGEHSREQWKQKCDGRIALWGGGVNSQVTLPLGTVEDIRAEVKEVVICFSRGGGYIFNSIHNLTAETEAEKIVALYETAASVD